MRTPLLLSLSLVLCVGCSAIAPTASRTGVKHVARKPAASQTLAPAGSSDPGVGAVVLAADEVARAVDQTLGRQSELIGKVKLLSDKGLGLIANNGGGLISDKGLGLIGNNAGGLVSNNAAGIISNHSGGLISDKALGLVANNGGGLVANNSGGLIGKTKYRTLADATAPLEFLLADADIEVLDAQGRVLVDQDGKPLTATTDATGSYHFKGVLPPGNLIFRIKLANQNLLVGGQLYAMVTRQADGQVRSLEIDTASSLGAGYVLGKYVKQKQSIYDRLPDANAQSLQAAVEGSRALLGGHAPSYQLADLAQATEDLRQKAPGVSQELQKIEAILLAGNGVGNGEKATQVALGGAFAVAGDAQGNVLVCEAAGNRMRTITPQGTINELVPASGSGGFVNPMDLVVAPDGSIYVAEMLPGRVRRIAPDGSATIVAGNGVQDQGATEVPATQTSIRRPAALGLAPDGTLYIGEAPLGGGTGRLLAVDPKGVLHQIATPSGPDWVEPIITGVSVGADGTLFIMNGHSGALLRKKPGASAWETVASGLNAGPQAHITAGPKGSIYVAGEYASQVWVFDANNHQTLVAGTGQAGFTGDGGPAVQANLSRPTDVWPAPDGTLYIADASAGVIRKVDLDGTIHTIAGAVSVLQEGEATTIPINSPTGLAYDSRGRLLITEATSDTVKLLDGLTISVFAGTVNGLSGDGGPATQAKFSTPGGVAVIGSDVYILDSSNRRIRKVDASGTVSTVVVSDKDPAPPAGVKVWPLSRPFDAVAGPDGNLYVSDNGANQVFSLTKDGQVRLVAGAGDSTEGFAGDGGPAGFALLSKPCGLTFDPQGNLYIADSGNLVVRKVDTQGNISTVAGIPAKQAILALSGYKSGTQENIDALAATLAGPFGLACDAQGALYIGEVGTTNLTALGGGNALAAGGNNAMISSMLSSLNIPAHIRRVGLDGKIATVAGQGSKLMADPTGANALGAPVKLLFDPKGRLVVADTVRENVRALPKGSF